MLKNCADGFAALYKLLLEVLNALDIFAIGWVLNGCLDSYRLGLYLERFLQFRCRYVHSYVFQVSWEVRALIRCSRLPQILKQLRLYFKFAQVHLWLGNHCCRLRLWHIVEPLKLQEFLLLNEIFNGYCENSMRGMPFHLILNYQFFYLAMLATWWLLQKLPIALDFGPLCLVPCALLCTFLPFCEAIH